MNERFPFAPRASWSRTADEDWRDWRWQLRNQLDSPEQLIHFLGLDEKEALACRKSLVHFRMGITPYYASLIDLDDPECPIRRQAVPRIEEMQIHPFDLEDPLGEEKDMPVPGLTHRYPDRVLFYISHTCAVYCRHCTRRRKVGDASSHQSKSQLEKAIDWIKNEYSCVHVHILQMFPKI